MSSNNTAQISKKWVFFPQTTHGLRSVSCVSEELRFDNIIYYDTDDIVCCLLLFLFRLDFDTLCGFLHIHRTLLHRQSEPLQLGQSWLSFFEGFLSVVHSGYLHILYMLQQLYRRGIRMAIRKHRYKCSQYKDEHKSRAKF